MSQATTAFVNSIQGLADSLSKAIYTIRGQSSASEDLSPNGPNTAPAKMPGSLEDKNIGFFLPTLSTVSRGGLVILLLGLGLGVLYFIRRT